MKKNNILLIFMLVALVFFPSYVFALGQMTEAIVIKNALRGENIEQELIAVNSDEVQLEVKFQAEGMIKDWTRFYLPDNLNDPLDSFSLPASGNLRVIAIMSIPKDIPNGEYTGALSVSNKTIDSGDVEKTGSDVIQKIDRQVSITISDSEEINIENTSVIPNKFDIEAGEVLSIRVIYNNQGNIRLSPQIRLRIKKDDKNLHDLIYPYPEEDSPVNPNSQHEINPILVQTTAWEEGKYKAFLSFSRGEEILLEKDFQFSVVAAKSESEKTFEKNTLRYWGGSLFILLLLSFVYFLFFKKPKVNSK